MNPKLRAFLEANGLRADATEQEAWAKFDELQAQGITLPGIDPGTRAAVQHTATAAAGAGSDPDPATPAQPVDVDAAVQRALAADATRRAAIEDRLLVAGLANADNGEFGRGLINDITMTVERASAAIFERLRVTNPPVGTGAFSSATVGVEGRDKLRAAVTDGLQLRSGISIENPAPGCNEFRGRTLVEISREVLAASGVNVRGLSNMEIAARALASSSTSDFPAILMALANKHLLAAYMAWPQTWRPFCAVTSANDFKDIYAVRLSGSPDLQGLGENGEYKTAAFSDAKENYRIITKGVRAPFTRQMLINDDMRAFTRIPQLFGAAAKRMEGDAVYSLITTNGNMSDGIALFHSSHNNLAGTSAAITSDSLGAGRASMRKQKGMSGERIDAQPAFLLVPVAKETTAEIILLSPALPTSYYSSGVNNPWSGKLTPIADPHLDDNSATAWYLFASPNQYPVIEVAYLQGMETPYVEEQVDFDSDALVIKVRHDFGSGVVDYVGAYKNAGA